MKLNQRNVDGLRLPAGKPDHFEWDDELPRFGVRLREGARPSWVVQYKVDGRTRRIKVALLSEMNAGAARNAAAAILARVQLGEDPQADKQQRRAQQADKFGPAVEIYLARRERDRGNRGNRDRTLTELKRYLHDERGAYWRPLHAMPITAITRRDIAARRAVIETECGATTAKQAKGAVVTFFRWCVQEGLLETNPTIGIKDSKYTPRARVLADDEVATVWRACRDDDYGKLVRLLLLTGCRREEIGGLQWNEIDLGQGTITLPPARTKNGREHVVPLSDAAREILQGIAPRATTPALFGQGGFTAWHKGKVALDRRIAEARGEPLADWRLHDTRRTVATGLAKLGIDLATTEKILNHAAGSFAGIVSVYQRHDFFPEKKRALAIWADHVLALVERRPSSVTPLRRA